MARILLIANTLPPVDLSGAGEQVLQLAAGLEAAGDDVTVLGRGPGGAGGPKVLFPLTIVLPTWRAVRRLRPDVVQVHESDGALAAVLVRLLRPWLRPRGKKTGPRLVALLQVSYREEIRAVRPLRYQDKILGRPGSIERRFLWTKGPVQLVLGILSARMADLVLACSRRTATEIERDYGVTGVSVLPNVTGGLPVPSSHVAPAETGLPEEAVQGYLLYVGRLRVRKGVEVLLEALPAARQAHPGLRLLLAGDGEQREVLERRCAELGLGDCVTFLGRCDAGRVRRLLAHARCLVVPSIYEGMPLVILEAMAEGTPVIASAVSGIPEVVLDGETGWLVPQEDPPALTAAMVAALADPTEASRRGDASRARVAACFTPAEAARLWHQAVSPARAATS